MGYRTSCKHYGISHRWTITGMSVFICYCCIIIYHKLRDLQQLIYYLTVLYVRSPGTAQLGLRLRVSQGQNLGVSWGCGSIWSLEYSSKLIQVVGRIQFLVVIHPRSQFFFLADSWKVALFSSRPPLGLSQCGLLTTW